LNIGTIRIEDLRSIYKQRVRNREVVVVVLLLLRLEE
jgi:hypothetical protein